MGFFAMRFRWLPTQ